MSEPPCRSRSFDFRIIKQEEEKNVMGRQIDISAASISTFLSQHIYFSTSVSHKLIAKWPLTVEV